jgi:hypothetical protein
VSIKIRETGILCPECEIPLVHIPRPDDDIAVCPACAAGGDYTDVVENGGQLVKPRIALDRLRELLAKYGFTRA